MCDCAHLTNSAIMKRRQFVGLLGNTSLCLLAGKLSVQAQNQSQNNNEFLFVEAE
jgi:hypothetical protein